MGWTGRGLSVFAAVLDSHLETRLQLLPASPPRCCCSPPGTRGGDRKRQHEGVRDQPQHSSGTSRQKRQAAQTTSANEERQDLVLRACCWCTRRWPAGVIELDVRERENAVSCSGRPSGAAIGQLNAARMCSCSFAGRGDTGQELASDGALRPGPCCSRAGCCRWASSAASPA